MLCTLFSLLSFSCFLHIVHCQVPVYVSLQAPTTVVYQQDKIQFTCAPIVPNVGSSDSISDIILQRNSTIGWQDIVKVYSDISTGSLQQKVTWTDTYMQGRASVITQITSPTNNAGLKIEISEKNVACSDDATYRCSISGNRGSPNIGKLDSQSTSVHVALKVEANSIDSIQVRPLVQDNIYYPGSVVTMTCSGEVGNPAGHLRWCIKREPLDNTFIGYPNSVDFIEGPPTLNGCQYRRSSVLTYNVTSSYTGVEFRCETGPTATCGLSTTIAANFTLTRYTESSNPGAQSSSETADAGVIAGAVIGSFVGVVIIVIIIYFVAFRKKSSGETYRTKEENGTGAAPIDNTVYSLPHKDRNLEQDEHLINDHPPPPPRPHKQELHYADLDIASNPPGVPPPKPKKPKPLPRRKNETGTEYAVVEFDKL